jgi:hypothetical protein
MEEQRLALERALESLTARAEALASGHGAHDDRAGSGRPSP